MERNLDQNEMSTSVTHEAERRDRRKLCPCKTRRNRDPEGEKLKAEYIESDSCTAQLKKNLWRLKEKIEKLTHQLCRWETLK